MRRYRNYKFAARCILDERIKEMSFGAWDNRRVCDIKSDDACHLFYRNQHALVKQSGRNGNNLPQPSENFCEVLLRAHEVLMDLNKSHAGKKIVMFSHSMFGAACCILLGKGQTFENGNYLAFDGKRSDGTSYTINHATPIALTMSTFEKTNSFSSKACS
jgi:broad specificity phosphatase PhoE